MHKLFNATLLLILFIEIALLCSCQNSSLISCIESERQALLKLKESFLDPSRLLSSWEGKNCCIWDGVSCDENNGRVVKLNLRGGDPKSWFSNGSYLEAREVNSCLLQLRYLEYLDLSGNDFQHSAIPQFLTTMTKLSYLNLSNAGFSGSVPGNLGNVTTLRVLDLSHKNQGWTLKSNDVEWISHLESLQQLSMAGIYLGDATNLFQVLNVLPSLRSLHFSQCGLNNSHFSRLLINFTFSGSIQSLDLEENNFEGPVPIALRNMTSLRLLNLRWNNFNSSIPNWFGNFKNLVHLNLADNKFSFSSTAKGLGWILGNMCYLKSLDLSYNMFQGKIVGINGNESGCAGHDLETLSLDYMGISGHLPDWLWMLKDLKYLHLSSNQLNGTIPESVGQLSKLETLDLSQNLLDGVVSEVHFAKLSKLKMLSIGFNNLTIKINTTWVPPFQLEYIAMESCKFETQFPQWLQTQFKATTLLLPNTSISGILPEWIKDMNLLEELDFSHNQITGLIPKFPSKLRSIDLSKNMLSGTLTQIIGHHSLLPELHVFALSENHVNGSIPSSLCHARNLESLQLSKNKLSGNIPDCWGEYQSINVFDLSFNNLSGAIPSSIGHLQYSLGWLHLSNNNLSGEPPLTLRNCSNLVVLDLGENALSGHVPNWAQDSFPFLNILRLRKNKFNGTIPRQLCQLSTLQILDLAENDLNGKIPHCFGKFWGMVEINVSDDDGFASGYYSQWDAEHLTEVMKGIYLEYTKNLRLLVSIDLSRNKLEGSIPEELTLLTGLIGLNLSYNQLSGNIPKKIEKLKWLESLDLSFNELSGKIPGGMASLTKLSHLNLSHNNLSGQIPTGNQLQTLDDPSIYAVNPLLCGALVLKKCLDDDEPPPHHQGDEDSDEDNPAEKMWLYIVIMSGFATGFWGVVGVLIFNKSWRHAYFLLVDRSKERVLVFVAFKMASVKNMMKGNHASQSAVIRY